MDNTYTNSWTGGLALTSPSTPILDTVNQVLWVGAGNGRLYKLEATDAKPVTTVYATLGTGTSPVGPPTLDESMTLLYVGTDAGQIYAVPANLQ